MDLTTVADDLVVVHAGTAVHRLDGLAPGAEFEVLGVRGRTLDRPPGERLSTVATVNDVHFGEVECGRIGSFDEGPILRRLPGERPYPDVMNEACATEVAALDPELVVVKGDLTAAGRAEEFAAFDRCWVDRFGPRIAVVRGNHDAYDHDPGRYAGHTVRDVPGLRVVVLDTVRPGHANGAVTGDGLTLLADTASDARRAGVPVLVLGHHPVWVPGVDPRDDRFFGLLPSATEALAAVIARQRAVIAYAAGHTHRNRVVRLPEAGGVPCIEVACVKDFPGSWAEYRVFEGGVLQVHHRCSSPEALAWSERCRVLYSDFGVDYVAYALGRLEDRCLLLTPR